MSSARRTCSRSVWAASGAACVQPASAALLGSRSARPVAAAAPMPTNTRRASPRARRRSARGWIAEPGEASLSRLRISGKIVREAAPVSEVADSFALGVHDGEQAIAHAVGAHLSHVVSTTVAARHPEPLARAAPQLRRALVERALHALLRHVLDHQDVVGRSVLKDHWQVREEVPLE